MNKEKYILQLEEFLIFLAYNYEKLNQEMVENGYIPKNYIGGDLNRWLVEDLSDLYPQTLQLFTPDEIKKEILKKYKK